MSYITPIKTAHGLHSLEIVRTEIGASWERPHKEGFRTLKVDKHVSVCWVQIVAVEHGKKSSRQVMLELNPQEIAALVEILQK